MHTVSQMQYAIGQTVALNCDGLQVLCEVADVRSVYGERQCLVSPLAGEGQRWVRLSSLQAAYPSKWAALAALETV